MTAPRHFHQAVAAAKAGINKGDSVEWFWCSTHRIPTSTKGAPDCSYVGPFATRQEAQGFMDQIANTGTLVSDTVTRPTADIVADLREPLPFYLAKYWLMNQRTEAADRLAELDNLLTDISTERDMAEAHLGEIRELLPEGATWEQLAATWRAVWDDANPIWRLGEFAHDIRDDLRAVKP